MKSTLVVAITLSMVALAGCIVDPGEDTPDPTPSPTVSPSPTNSTNDTGSNLPDGPALEIKIGATNTSGEAPLLVTFNLSTTSSYAEFLDWTFDADGDGASDGTGYGLPADVAHNFTEAGNYTATLEVTDPEGRMANTTLEVIVQAKPQPVLPEPIVFEGTASGAEPDFVYGSSIEHTFNHTVPVDKITFTFEVSTTGFDYDFYVIGPDGEEIDRAASFNEPTGEAYPQVEPPIVVDDPQQLSKFGTWTVKVTPYVAVEADYKVTVTFE